jgi:DedD protein
MQRGLGGAAFEPVPQSRDREITLGPFLLTFLGCGLFALCGLCFMFGYAVGNRNTEPASAAPLPPAVTPAMLAANAQSKPLAGQNDAEPQQPSDDEAATQPDAAAGVAPAPASSGQPGSSSDPAVRTLPVSQTASGQPVSASGVVQPALAAQPSGIMVQIAAVSQQEDADVLVGALRKRGYAVSAHRDPADGLLHVQVGPFASRNDALAMRQKLLNDGYNAVVQP